MPVTFKSVLIPVAKCDVCGAEQISAYMTVSEDRDLEPHERVEGGTDPRVKVVLCTAHSGAFTVGMP